MKLRILFSHYGTIDGGDACGFTRSFALARGLVNFDNEVFFLTTQKNTYKFPYLREERDGVIIIAFPEILPYAFRKGGLSPLSTLFKIVFVLFKKAEVVHSDTGHRPASGLSCIIHRFIYKSKYFSEWWEHFGPGGIYDEMPKWYQLTIGLIDRCFEEKNRKSADACIPISTKLAIRANLLGIDKRRILVVNGGADINKIPFVEDNALIKKEFGLDSKKLLIGIIGINDEEITNHWPLIEAIKDFNGLNNERQIELFCTGKVTEAMNNKIKDYDIKVFGWLSYTDFCKLICCADVFALVQKKTLRNESRFPNKLGDYLAAGRPILTNKVGEVNIYIEKYPEAFYLIDDDKTNPIMKILGKIYTEWINKDVDYKRIRQIAIDNSWLKRSEQLNNFYREICNN